MQMVRVLESANHWQFDAFKLCEVTEGHTLSALGYYTLHQAGLINHFRMKPTHLARFLRAVEDGYINNPYHNKTHAADVLQTFHLILRRGGLIPGYVDPLTHVACLLAAVVHDFEHVGRTNDFLINTGSDLAILYNDRAPLENHHLAAAFQLLRKPEFNFMPDLTKAEHDKLRKTVIDLVLATDMKQHFSIVSHFTTVHRLGSGGSMAPSAQIVVPLDETERMISLQLALKCADLGHTAAALPVHLKWVAGLEEEFFRQGDAERAAGLPISPLFDRMKQGISKSQVGFFDIVVIPLYHSFSRVFTGTKPLLTFVMRNYKVWNEQQRLAGGAQ
ncbi:3'5'-cyclic nucleotide phosphodiesterase [Haematococcus lacustris]